MAPDATQIIYCLARAILQKLRPNFTLPESKKITISIFDERRVKLFSKFENIPPSFNKIHKFLTKLFTYCEISPECGVMAIAYVDRLYLQTGITFDQTNWRPIVFTALLLASKAWEEASVWNADYAKAFKGIILEAMNNLEREFLMRINYKLGLSSSVYTRYYFEVRSLSVISDENFPVKPLDKRTAIQLEARCFGAEERVKRFHIHSSKCLSLDTYEAGQTRMSLEEFRSMKIRNGINLENFA